MFSEDSGSSIYRKKCKKGAIFSGFVKNSTESWTKNFNPWNNSTESWTKNFNLWNKVIIFYWNFDQIFGICEKRDVVIAFFVFVKQKRQFKKSSSENMCWIYIHSISTKVTLNKWILFTVIFWVIREIEYSGIFLYILLFTKAKTFEFFSWKAFTLANQMLIFYFVEV